MKRPLIDYTYSELKDELRHIGEKSFRAKQILKWISEQKPIEEMTDLSKVLRSQLRKEYGEGYAESCRVLSAADGTKKYLFRYLDGSTVESVFMPKNYGNTICVSTQVGCRMGCAFCASCRDGLKRNLTAGEILAQVIAVNAEQGPGRNIDHIVLMGMGEPLDNYDHVVRFIRMVNEPEGMGIGLRGISLSTCGLTDEIKKLSEEGLGITLSISLHAASDEKRLKIMPTAQKYKIAEILDAARTYFLKTGRRIIIEYAVIDGFNDTKNDARMLKEILTGMNCHVNLIPLNGNDGITLKAPCRRKVYAFCNMLEKEGLSATVRKSMGSDIAGACGQLRQQYVGKNGDRT